MILQKIAVALGAAGCLVLPCATAAHAHGGPPRTTCVNKGGAIARGTAIGSPGFLSGNLVQIPVYAPVNFCGNHITLLGGGGGPGGPG
ncbi:chaplin [Streptomyces sp. NPDC001480]|uniref:chaplin n=1 Tax=Streptomyces sp. NPDC001480 TaxID=3364577 RepID=UPI003679B2F4